MKKDKVIKYCDRVMEISLYGIAFYIPISNALIEIFACLAIAALIVKKIISWPNPEGLFKKSFLNLPIFLYVLVCFISVIFSSNFVISLKHFVFKTVEYSLVFFIVVEVIDKRILRNLLIALLFSSFLTGLDGIFQYFAKVDFLRRRPLSLLVEGVERINGPFKVPNDFANYIVSLVFLPASLYFVKFKKKWIKIILVVISLTLFVSILFSATRSAWIGFAFAVLLLAALGNRRLVMIILLIFTIALCFLPYLPNSVQSRMLNFFNFREGATLTQRELLWKMSFNMFVDKPLFGQGLGTFMQNFAKFKPANYPGNWEVAYAHNCFLQIAAETGALGIISFLAMISVLFFVLIKDLFRMKKDNYFYILLGILPGLLAYLAGSFFDTNLYSLPLSVLFWMMMGLAVGAMKVNDSVTTK